MYSYRELYHHTARDCFLNKNFGDNAKELVKIGKGHTANEKTKSISEIENEAISFFKTQDVCSHKDSRLKDIIADGMRKIIIETIDTETPPGDDDYNKRNEIYEKIEQLFPFIKKRQGEIKLNY